MPRRFFIKKVFSLTLGGSVQLLLRIKFRINPVGLILMPLLGKDFHDFVITLRAMLSMGPNVIFQSRNNENKFPMVLV